MWRCKEALCGDEQQWSSHPAGVAACIRARRQAGAAFVIVEQNLSFLLPLLQQVLVLDHGEIVCAGPAGPDDRETLERHLRV